MDSVYGGESGLPDLNYCIATTIAELEASNDPNPQCVYYVVDPGKEGPFLYDPGIRNGHSGVYYPFHVDGVTVRDCDMDNTVLLRHLRWHGLVGRFVQRLDPS